MSPLRKPAQVARVLGVSHPTVLGYIRSGQLEAVELGIGGGPPYGIKETSVEEFIRSRSTRRRAQEAHGPRSDHRISA